MRIRLHDTAWRNRISPLEGALDVWYASQLAYSTQRLRWELAPYSCSPVGCLSRRQARRVTHRRQSLSGMIARCNGSVLNSFAATA